MCLCKSVIIGSSDFGSPVERSLIRFYLGLECAKRKLGARVTERDGSERR